MMKTPKRIRRENVTVGVAALNGLVYMVLTILVAAGVVDPEEFNPANAEAYVALVLGLFGIGGAHHVAREQVRRQAAKDAAEAGEDGGAGALHIVEDEPTSQA